MISTKQLFAADEFSTSLAAALHTDDTAAERSSGIPQAGQAMRRVYTFNEFSPMWVAEDGITEAAELLLQDLDSLRHDGIDPERYGLMALSSAMEQLKKAGDLPAALAFDTACTRAWLQASRDLLMGVVSPRKADSLWFHGNDSSWSGAEALALQLDSIGNYPSLAAYRSRIPTYALLRQEYARYAGLSKDAELQSLKRSISGKILPDSVLQAITAREFPWIKPLPGDTMTPSAQIIRGVQERYGLAPTGKADTATIRRLQTAPEEVMSLIAANMERLRWMPQSLGDQYVLVNVPLMELFLRHEGRDAFHMRVVVGKPSRQTPSLHADLANIVFSPSWGVPPTILKNDVLPGITKRGPAYLARKGLHAYDRKGRRVSAHMVTADNFRKFTFRQPPGDDNALGDIKFNLPNKWDIYLHDTPHREDFPRRYRAKSSGCIRVEQPRELAEYILRDMEGREEFDQFRIDSLVQVRQTKFVNLKSRIPVHIVYLTAFEDESGAGLRLLPDIYKKDKKLMAALSAI